MKDIEMHKFLGTISRDLAWIHDKIKEKDIQEEIYEVRRKILKKMIRIEHEIWKEERENAKNVVWDKGRK